MQELNRARFKRLSRFLTNWKNGIRYVSCVMIHQMHQEMVAGIPARTPNVRQHAGGHAQDAVPAYWAMMGVFQVRVF